MQGQQDTIQVKYTNKESNVSNKLLSKNSIKLRVKESQLVDKWRHLDPQEQTNGNLGVNIETEHKPKTSKLLGKSKRKTAIKNKLLNTIGKLNLETIIDLIELMFIHSKMSLRIFQFI